MPETGDGLLDALRGPEDLRSLSVTELERLAAEIRERIIAQVSKTGGHLAPRMDERPLQ